MIQFFDPTWVPPPGRAESDSEGFFLGLTLDTAACHGQGFEARLGDLDLTIGTFAVGAVFDAIEGRIDVLDDLLLEALW